MASLWRSTSLRWSVLLTLVLWFLTMTVAIGVAERTEQVLIDGPSEIADELEAFFMEQLDAERFNHPDFWAEDYAGTREALTAQADESFLGALQRYRAQLDRRLQASTGRALQEVQARLWLLGEAVPLHRG